MKIVSPVEQIYWETFQKRTAFIILFDTGGGFVKSALYANEELLKSLFQNITPDLSLKYILIQARDMHRHIPPLKQLYVC